MIWSGLYSAMSILEPLLFCEAVQNPGLAACSHQSHPAQSTPESARTSRISSRTRKRFGTRLALLRSGLVRTRRLSFVITLKSLLVINPPVMNDVLLGII